MRKSGTSDSKRHPIDPATGSVPTRILSRRRFLRLAALGGTAVSGLAFLEACSPPQGAPAAPPTAAPKLEVTARPAPTLPAVATAAPTSPPAAAAPAQQKPQSRTRPGSQVTIVQGTEPNTLDPHFELSGAIGTALNPMVHHLADYDRDSQIVPDAAESFEILPDGVTYRFKLKRNMRFWNGEPLNAKAVKFSYDRSMDPELRKQGLNDPLPQRQGVTEVKVIDDYTVDVITKTPSAITLPLFSQVFILAPGHYGSKSPQEVARNPMGSGPWKLKEWVKDDHMSMVANPDYYLGAPQIETLVYRPVPDRNTRVAMLEAGQADLVTGLAYEDLDILNRLPSARVVAVESDYKMHLGIPTNVPRYSDKRVRHALAMAIDFDSINQHILGGLAKGRLASPATGSFWESPNLKPFPHDPARARQLLEASSFPFNEKVTIHTFNGSFMKDFDIARAVAADFRKIGLNADAQAVESSVLVPLLRSRKIEDLYLNGLAGRNFGPNDLNILNKNSSWDASHWLETSPRAEEFNKLSDTAQQSLDPKVQQENVWKAMEIFMDEAPWILLHREIFLFGVNKRIDWTPTGYSRLNPWLPGEDDVRFVQ